MKITVVALFASVFSIYATEASSQNAKVSIHVNQRSTKEVIAEIEKQTEYLFVYNGNEVDVTRQVSLDVKNKSVSDVLNTLFANTNISYKLVGKNISLIVGNSQMYPVSQQKGKVINGVVVDQAGIPIIGANVVEKGTTNGVISDIDGKYSLSVSEGAILQITYIGYVQQAVKVGKESNLQIVLKEDSQALDEVIVVGYGVQKKRDLTGAISSVKMDDAPVSTFSTISHALAGKASGLQVTQNSAQVGGGATFRIRGAASTGAGNDPLVIIDGFPVSSGSSLGSGTRYSAGSTDNLLASLNPNDIESIEVLKDASSTAIYGSRAGHGVIIITTKRGKQQKAQVRYSGNISVQNMKNGYEVLDGPEYMKQRNRYNYENYLKTNGLDVYKEYVTLKPGHVVPDFVPVYSETDIANAQTTDWFGSVTRTGMMQTHNLSINGGTESTQFMTSLNYTGQKGVVDKNNMDRFTGKINMDQTLSKYVKAGLSLNIARNSFDNVPIGEGQFENAGVISAAATFNPTLPIYDEKGNFTINPDFTQLPNPVSLLDITDKTTKDRMLASAYVQAEPVEGFILKANFGVDRQNEKRKVYLPKTTMYGAAVNGQASVRQYDRNDYLMDFTATYSREFGNHSLTALLGYSFQQFNYEDVSAENKDFLIDSFLFNNLGAGNYTKPSVGSSAYKSALGSYFSRINYSYLGRYLMTLTVRADGASNFDPDNRWGYFPSVSTGWRFSDEAFMQPFSNYLSNGKLRASYGQTGNSNVGNRTMDLFGSGYNNVFGNSAYTGVYASQLGNHLLTWETTSEFNIGLDLGFFNNRISTTFEYFNRTISDLLVSGKSLPSYNEITSIAANIGKTQSQGFEFSLNTVNVSSRDWSWSTDATFSLYRDRWKERDVNWKPAAYQHVDDPIRSTFTYVSDGLLKAGEKAPVHQAALLPGQVKLVDQNNDGVLNDKDMVRIGTQDPAFLFGLNNTLRYKNVDLNVYFYGEANRLKGPSYYDSWATKGYSINQSQNVSTGYMNTWSHENQGGNYPNILGSNDYGVGDYMHKKISYIRCRNITVGYTLPVSKNVVNSIRAYVDVNNPFVITNWRGLDPETEGHQFSYPNVTSFSFGVDVAF
ncbi:MAG: TonB-dependent receptor [Macellibacteroides fermentans]|uniref:TonB-dependent receptor n=1 Tax=Macellibacteroides fermentans TaxID=879969 RepID=UPI003AD2A6DA